MNFDDVLNIYHQRRKIETGYRFIGELFKEIKQQYLAETTAEDKNQSWNSWSGKTFQKLIEYSIKEFVETCGYPVAVTSDSVLRRNQLSPSLEIVKRNILVFYADFALVPDADVVLYDKNSGKIISILSCKASLRERIAQAAYWKIKLSSFHTTQNILCYLISTDNDKDFIRDGKDSSRNRIIVEHGELDGAYIFREIPESGNVKQFDKIFPDLTLIFEGWFNNQQDS